MGVRGLATLPEFVEYKEWDGFEEIERREPLPDEVVSQIKNTDAGLDTLTEKRGRERTESIAEREERRYREMVAEETQSQRECNRRLWVIHHERQAKRIRALLEGMARYHEDRAEKYRKATV